MVITMLYGDPVRPSWIVEDRVSRGPEVGQNLTYFDICRPAMRKFDIRLPAGRQTIEVTTFFLWNLTQGAPETAEKLT